MEAKSSEETKFCSNCRRDIAASNYLMHTMHCLRNLVLCKRCNEPVPRNELDQHMQELHSQVPCGKCSSIVECCELEEHMHTQCPKRIVKCSFCDLECIWDEMKTHESYCGSRTEVCSFCGQYVMIKEKEEHDLGNCAKVAAKKQSENNRADSLNNTKSKGRSGSYSKMPEDAVRNSAIQPKIWNYQPSGTLEEPIDKHRISSDASHSTFDEQLALDLAREDLENLQASHFGELWDNVYDDETVLPFHRTIVPTMLGARPVIPGYSSDEFIIPVVDQIPQIQADGETTKVDSDEVELPCEFCGELYPSEILIQHQSGCNPEMAHDTTVDGISNNNSASSKTHSSGQENQLKDRDAIPCEFCDQCFPSDYLIEHEAGCNPEMAHGTTVDSISNNNSASSKTHSLGRENQLKDTDTIPCEFCDQGFPSDCLIEHESGCNPEMAHGTTMDGVSNNNSASSKTHSSGRENLLKETDTIPCEFCDQCFPSDCLIDHESQCRPDIAHGPPPWAKKDKQVVNKTPVMSNHPDNTSIPCEFCGELFSHHLIIGHQATCDANSLEPILSDELYPSVNESTVERKQQTLKHQEDPKLEEIASLTTSSAFRKERDVLPITNEKSSQIVRKSPNKELDSINETSMHNCSRRKTLYDSKRKNIASNFSNIDSYFERSERNYHRLQKRDKALDDILRRVPEYRNLHDVHQQCHTPFRERDNPFYSDKLNHRHEWSSSQAGARPKSCSDSGIQDGFPHQVSLSRDPYSIDTQGRPKFTNRLAATFSPLPENLSRGIRETRPSEFPIGHIHLQPSNHENGSDIGGKPKGGTAT